MRGAFAGLLGLALLLAGGCSSTRPGDFAAVQPISDQPRVGNVYLLRGWIGVFSTGIDSMAEKLQDAGVRAHVFQQLQWRQLADVIAKRYREHDAREPLILIGHSYGADGVIGVARRLERQNIPVDLIITLDPVTPDAVPPNVRTCINLYQSNGPWDHLPFLRGIRLEKQPDAVATQLVNADLRVDRRDLLEPGVSHFNIEKQPRVHAEVVRTVLRIAVERESSPQLARSSPATQPTASRPPARALPPPPRTTGEHSVSAHTTPRAEPH
jgi:hypothetical protein